MLNEILLTMIINLNPNYTSSLPDYKLETIQEYAITSTRKNRIDDIDLENLNPYKL